MSRGPRTVFLRSAFLISENMLGTASGTLITVMQNSVTVFPTRHSGDDRNPKTFLDKGFRRYDEVTSDTHSRSVALRSAIFWIARQRAGGYHPA